MDDVVVPSKRYKIVFLGEADGGKTSIIYRYVYNTFQEPYLGTIGVDFVSHAMSVEGTVVRVQVWDTAALPLNDPVQADETPAAKKLYQRQPELMPFVVGLRAAKYGKGESHPETGELTLINRPEEGGITGTGLIRPAIDVAARGVWRRGGTGLGNAGSGDAVP